MLPCQLKPSGTIGPISVPTSSGATGMTFTVTFSPTARNASSKRRRSAAGSVMVTLKESSVFLMETAALAYSVAGPPKGSLIATATARAVAVASRTGSRKSLRTLSGWVARHGCATEFRTEIL